MAQTNQIISLAELKKYMDWAADDLSSDDFFNQMIDAVSDCLEQYCNTKIKKCDVTEMVSGQGGLKLYLSNRPITEVKAIEYFDGDKFSEYMSGDDIKKYIVSSCRAIYNRAEFFDEGVFNYRVTYTCGYDPPPQDLKLISLELCAILFKNSFLGEGRVGLVSNQQGNFKMFFLEQLPFHKRVIDKYRLINI